MDLIKNILPSSLLRNRIKNQVQACSVLDSFSNLVRGIWGEEVAKMVKAKYVKEKILYVHCSASSVANALSLARKKLVEEINKAQEEKVINDIVFLQ
ncbi:MAG: DciA family protein [Patescibacteria group bacterium]|nr:DciA family protein [Patescibacteria group bacterium]